MEELVTGTVDRHQLASAEIARELLLGGVGDDPVQHWSKNKGRNSDPGQMFLLRHPLGTFQCLVQPAEGRRSHRQLRMSFDDLGVAGPTLRGGGEWVAGEWAVAAIGAG